MSKQVVVEKQCSNCLWWTQTEQDNTFPIQIDSLVTIEMMETRKQYQKQNKKHPLLFQRTKNRHFID